MSMMKEFEQDERDHKTQQLLEQYPSAQALINFILGVWDELRYFRPENPQKENWEKFYHDNFKVGARVYEKFEPIFSPSPEESKDRLITRQRQEIDRLRRELAEANSKANPGKSTF